MLVSDFNYELPEELIAQEPLRDRAASRLLHVESGTGAVRDLQFRDFPDLLRPSDLVVFNNTRVFPARLYGRRGGLHAQPVSARNPAAREFLHGRIEVLLTKQVSQEPNEWECLVRPGRKIGVGERLFFGENDELVAEVMARGEFGERRVRFASSKSPTSAAKNAAEMGHPSSTAHFFEVIEKIGHVPLPPYIARADSTGDRERYQTVYARERGSVAAPTAGLHFTPEILTRIRERGIETAEITLHVGLGTFQPVRTGNVEEHRLHSEAYSISEEAAEKLRRAKSEERRVVAVGTTTVRTLEYAALSREDPHFSREEHARNGAPGKNPHPISQRTRKKGGAPPFKEVVAGSGEANLFIYPGYEFQVVGALLTNFHLPQSTLLMLVCALGGKEKVMRAYEHAVAQKYRFYSYGDCMFVE